MNQNPWIIDTFTSVPFRGNPAAVYLCDEFPEDGVMQLRAAQANLSETAFVVRRGNLEFDLRWFTPETEVDLCGHATLAAAHVLLQAGAVRPASIVRFNTRSGELRAKIMSGSVELNFPVLAGSSVKPDSALKALGVEIFTCYKNRDDYLVEVKDFSTLLAIKPDFARLAKMSARGVIVTTAAGVHGYDFASRFFAPGVGINEDPVTGSAHCFLAPYWAERFDKKSFHCLQASRGQGVLDVTLAGERVLISGKSVTTIRGDINLQKSKKEN